MLGLSRLSFYRNLERISGIAWQDARPVRHLVASLEPHQFLYINTRSGKMFRSRTPVPQPLEPR